MFYILYKNKQYSVSRDVYYTLIDLEEKNDFDSIELLFETSDDIHVIERR